MGVAQFPRTIAQLVPDEPARVAARTALGITEGGEVEIPVNPSYVLMFPDAATDHRHVDHGNFWRQPDNVGVDLGSGFFWGSWFAPLDEVSSGYLIADGGSGGHALLWGLAGNNRSSGNIWNGSATGVSFGGYYSIAIAEWCHFAVSWDGVNITTWINGIRDGSTPYNGLRKTLRADMGRSNLYVGGSNHSNLSMKLAWIEGYDNVLPQVPYWVSQNKQAFCPPRFPWLWDKTGLPVDFACDYTKPTNSVILDLSEGYAPPGLTPKRRHHGHLDVGINPTLGGGNLGGGPGGPGVDGPVPGGRPYWVIDDTCPFGKDWGTPESLGEVLPTPLSVPGGAKIFDSFARANQTWASHVAPSLGQTEGGSLGPKTWITRNTWGIIGGREGGGAREGFAVPIGGGEAGALPVAIVMNDSPDMTVSIYSPLSVGSVDHANKTSTFGPDRIVAVWRAVDTSNYWYAWWSWEQRTLVVGYMTNLGATRVGSPVQHIDLSGNVLKVKATGTLFEFFYSDTKVYELTGQTIYQTAVGCGMGSSESIGNADSGIRYGRFTVS